MREIDADRRVYDDCVWDEKVTLIRQVGTSRDAGTCSSMNSGEPSRSSLSRGVELS